MGAGDGGVAQLQLRRFQIGFRLGHGGLGGDGVGLADVHLLVIGPRLLDSRRAPVRSWPSEPAWRTWRYRRPSRPQPSAPAKAVSSLSATRAAAAIGVVLLLGDLRLGQQRFHARQIGLRAVGTGLARVHVGAGVGEFRRRGLLVRRLASPRTRPAPR